MTTTFSQILHPDLAEFAAKLKGRDFRVFVFKSDVDRVAKGGKEACATHLSFSRIVDGQECFGSVSRDLGGYSFTMPIRPSRENGSSMFIGLDRATETDLDGLTIPAAELYASPFGSNSLVGRQANFGNEGYAHLYVEVVA